MQAADGHDTPVHDDPRLTLLPAPHQAAMGPLERRQLIVAALERHGYAVVTSESLSAFVAQLRQDQPGLVGVTFQGRDVPLHFACFSDAARVSLRFGARVRARARHCQEWNRTRMFSKAYADSDGELALDHDFSLGGSWDEAQFIESVRVFVTSAVLASVWFQERAHFDRRDLLRWASWVLGGFGAWVFLERLFSGR